MIAINDPEVVKAINIAADQYPRVIIPLHAVGALNGCFWLMYRTSFEDYRRAAPSDHLGDNEDPCFNVELFEIGTGQSMSGKGFKGYDCTYYPYLTRKEAFKKLTILECA